MILCHRASLRVKLDTEITTKIRNSSRRGTENSGGNGRSGCSGCSGQPKCRIGEQEAQLEGTTLEKFCQKSQKDLFLTWQLRLLRLEVIFCFETILKFKLIVRLLIILLWTFTFHTFLSTITVFDVGTKFTQLFTTSLMNEMVICFAQLHWFMQ